MQTIPSLSETHRYWLRPYGPNDPVMYLRSDKWKRSEFLVERIAERLPTSASILEIGCNAGRNLAALHRAGFTNLSAIEINPDAIALMRVRFPELDGVKVHQGAAEVILPELPKFNAIFTMAVLQHINPESQRIFADIARRARRYVFTIEDERSWTDYHYPRNYGDEFTRVGLDEVETLDGLAHIGLDDNFVYRCFHADAQT